MIKCIVIDDEKPARDEVAFLINEHNDFQVVDMFGSAKVFLENMKLVGVDLLFVDVNMPGMNGIELVQHLRDENIDIHIVFVTAYDDHAIKAFELHAVDYLLKPVSDERMNLCLDRIKEHLHEHEYDHRLNQIMDQFKPKKEHLCLHRDGKIVPVKLSEIIFVRAENKGTFVETTKGSFTTSVKLSDFEKKLFDEDFFRCHRSFLINLTFIINIEPWFNRTYQVELEGTTERIPISRNYVQNFKDMMNIL